MAESLKQRAAKGLFWGGMNNVVQQIVGLVFGVILSRLLMPADYGMVAMIAVFQLVGNALQDSGFRTALVNEKAPADEDFNAVFWFNISAATLLYALLFVCSPLIARFYGVGQLTWLCRYAFLALVINSFATSQVAWLHRNLRMKQMAKAGMTAVVVSCLTGAAMAFAGCSYWSLVTQNIVYVSVSGAMMWHYSEWRPSCRNITMRPVLRMMRFAMGVLATNIATHINSNVLNVLLGRLCGTVSAGLYNQAWQWNTKGQNIVQNMLSLVAQPVLVDMRDERERRLNALRKMVRFTVFLSFPLMLGLGLVAREFIVLLLTDKWLPSAAYIQIMCVGGAVAPLSALLSGMVLSDGRSGLYFCGTSLLGVTLLLATITFHPLGLMAMVQAYTITVCLWLFVWFAMVRLLANYSVWHFCSDTIPFALAAVVTMVLTHYATLPITSLWLLLVARIVMAATLYCAVMLIAKVDIMREVLQFAASVTGRRDK